MRCAMHVYFLVRMHARDRAMALIHGRFYVGCVVSVVRTCCVECVPRIFGVGV